MSAPDVHPADRLYRVNGDPDTDTTIGALIEANEGAPLTPRETEVLRLTAKGLTLNEVAAALGISRHTVSGYLKDIYRKLSVGTRAEAALEAARRGLVAP